MVAGGAPGPFRPGQVKLRPLDLGHESKGVNGANRRSDKPAPPAPSKADFDERVYTLIVEQEPTTMRRLAAAMPCGLRQANEAVSRLRDAGRVTPASSSRGGFIVAVKGG